MTDRPAHDLPPDMESLEARVRLKMEMREPLTPEERAFFARMPADKGLTPVGAREAQATDNQVLGDRRPRRKRP